MGWSWSRGLVLESYVAGVWELVLEPRAGPGDEALSWSQSMEVGVCDHEVVLEPMLVLEPVTGSWSWSRRLDIVPGAGDWSWCLGLGELVLELETGSWSWSLEPRAGPGVGAWDLVVELRPGPVPEVCSCSCWF